MPNTLFNWSESTWAMLDQLSIILSLLLPLFSLIAAGWAFFNKERIKKLKEWYKKKPELFKKNIYDLSGLDIGSSRTTVT